MYKQEYYVFYICDCYGMKIVQNGHLLKKSSLTVRLHILGIIATYMNFHARQINWQLWEQNKEEFFYKDTTITTMDAVFFLGIAGYLKSETMDEYQSRVYFLKIKLMKKDSRYPLRCQTDCLFCKRYNSALVNSG